MTPTLGSMVQKGKFALWAFAFERQLNKVDLPTLGSPTIPHFNAMAVALNSEGEGRQSKAIGFHTFSTIHCMSTVGSVVLCTITFPLNVTISWKSKH
jgi:hypothetical protein